MSIEQRVLEAQKDNHLRNELIADYQNFIASCASKSIGRFVSDQDDEWSVAMMAFNEAITKYNHVKGTFISFASMIIKHRLIDYARKEQSSHLTVSFSSLSETDKHGNEIAFDIEDVRLRPNDIKYEIENLTKELQTYQISFFDLPKVTPKSHKTKHACNLAIRYILSNEHLVSELKAKGTLPIKELCDALVIHRKVVERHRKYILAAVIICTGEYESIAEYFKFLKEV